MQDKKISVSPKVIYKVHLKGGHSELRAYEFAKTLATLKDKPTLFDFNSRMTEYRLMTGYGDCKFRKLLNEAISYRYARFEGKHLRLISRNKEKKIANYRSKVIYTDIPAKDLRGFIGVSLLESNTICQRRYLKVKQSANLKKAQVSQAGSKQNLPDEKTYINEQITLSCRSAAKILGCSVSTAHGKLRSYKEKFGLVLEDNKTIISMGDFRFMLFRGSKGVRYDKKTKEYYYIGARLPKFPRRIVPIPCSDKNDKGITYTNDWGNRNPKSVVGVYCI